MKRGVHPDIWLLGIVSFLTDISSEMIFSVFALFFTAVAGGTAALLGIVEGVADFSSCSLDYFSGWLSDKTGKRKSLALCGYGFSALAKLTLLVANSLPVLTGFRVIERLGKSFRGPPRDAWISAIASRASRGYSFGVHKALDKAGAVLGPLIAYFILSSQGQSNATFSIIWKIAVIPAILAVAVLLAVKEKPGKPHKRERLSAAWKLLNPGFRKYLLAAGLFSLAYFSFGFLLLKAHSAGFSVPDITLLYALFNVSFVLAAAPIGRLGDRIGRQKIVLASYLCYSLMSIGFIFANQQWHIVLLFILFGIFYAMDEAQTKAFVSDMEKERRATAIGAYNSVTGIMYVPASAIAGVLWTVNPAFTFSFAAIISLAAMGIFVLLKPWKNK